MPTNPFRNERGRERGQKAAANLDNAVLTARASHSATLKNLEAKKQIVNQVIDGGLPLFDAATRFQAIGSVLAPISGGIDRELACRTLIGWVGLALSDQPERADVITDRLERELQSFLEGSHHNRAN